MVRSIRHGVLRNAMRSPNCERSDSGARNALCTTSDALLSSPAAPGLLSSASESIADRRVPLARESGADQPLRLVTRVFDEIRHSPRRNTFARGTYQRQGPHGGSWTR